MNPVPSASHEPSGVDQSDAEPDHTEEERCRLLQKLGELACASSQCLQTGMDGDGHSCEVICSICDATPTRQSGTRRILANRGGWCGDWKDVTAALLAILQLQEFRESTKPRVYMALAIRRVFNHISDAGYLDLEQSSCGEWLLSSMTRSLRELRISAV
jgi:serine/threonine-protein kinase ATR